MKIYATLGIIALLALPMQVAAAECVSSTLAESIKTAEEIGGYLFDMLPVKDNPDIDNVVIIALPDNFFGITLERDGCIVGPPVSTMVILPKDKGLPS